MCVTLLSYRALYKILQSGCVMCNGPTKRAKATRLTKQIYYQDLIEHYTSIHEQENHYRKSQRVQHQDSTMLLDMVIQHRFDKIVGMLPILAFHVYYNMYREAIDQFRQKMASKTVCSSYYTQYSIVLYLDVLEKS